MSASKLAKKYTRSLYGKIFIAFLLGCTTIIFALRITQNSFRKMLGTVQQLSAPNEKLKLVNSLFRDVVSLDQKQRAQTLRDSNKQYNPFIKESIQLQKRLDTLRALSMSDEGQRMRIDSMKQLLRERDRLFVSYLRLRAQLLNDHELSEQLMMLNTMIAENSTVADSNIITTEKKVTTTTIVPIDSMLETPETQEEKKSIWDKLFGRKKSTPQPLQKLIREELNIRVDTLATIREDSLVARLGAAVQSIEQKRQTGRNILLNRELRLTRAGNMLVSQVLEILQDIEAEELVQAENNTTTAHSLFNNSVDRMNTILACFMTGTALLILLIISDLVRSNRYRRQLVMAKEEAENLGMVKQRFLANMSHELRTPLQAIIGFSEQLKQQQHPAPEDINIIHRSSLHLLQIVNEVLDYSRIVSGSFALDPHPFDMQQLLAEVAGIMRQQAENKGLSLIFTTSISEPLPVTGDAFRMRQILFNLLGNAIKYTAAGQVLFEVTHHTEPGGIAFRFGIKDTGEGIPEADLERIFLQFEQATTAANSTGLGLSIVKALTDSMGGSVTAENNADRGALFTVAIVLPAAANLPERLTETSIATVQLNGCVWITDDDPFILKLCTTILEKHHIRYRAFSDPLQAADAIPPPDLVLAMIDIRMPGMSGPELFQLLQQKTGAGVKFVALTAQALPDERDHILEQGFDYLLMKPFMEKDFLEALAIAGHVKNITAARQKNESLNLSAIRIMTGGDEALLRAMLESFAVETAKDLEILEAAVTTNNIASYTEALHRIASRVGQLGDKPLAATIREAEIALRNGGVLSAAQQASIPSAIRLFIQQVTAAGGL